MYNNTQDNTVDSQFNQEKEPPHQQQGFFLVIPTHILENPNIDDATALLFGRISSLSNMRGYCYASDKYLAKLTRTSLRTLQRRIELLKKYNYIKVESKRNGMFWDRRIFPNYNYEATPMTSRHATHDVTEATPVAEDIYKSNKDKGEKEKIYKKESQPSEPQEPPDPPRGATPPPSPSKSKPKKKDPDAGKEVYGEHGNVRMTPDQRNALDEKLGASKAQDYIERLDIYLGSKGRKYKCHYLTILSFERKDRKEEESKPMSYEDIREAQWKRYEEANPGVRGDSW